MVLCATARTKTNRILLAKCDIFGSYPWNIPSICQKKRLEEVNLIVLKLMSHLFAGGDWGRKGPRKIGGGSCLIVHLLKDWVTLNSLYWNIVKGISNTAIACSSQLNLRLMLSKLQFLNFDNTPACKSKPNFCLKITSFKMLTSDRKEFKLCKYIGANFLGRALFFCRLCIDLILIPLFFTCFLY